MKWHVQPGEDLQSLFDRLSPHDTVYLHAGTYRQKAMLRVPHVTLAGEDMDKTLICHDDYAQKKDEQGREYNTFRTWTLAICADHVTVRNLSVVNDAGNPKEKGQEVALTVLGDRFEMENCRLASTQDTLFAGPLPPDLIQRYEGFLSAPLRLPGPFAQRYAHCLIEGSVDFIFGCADAVFEQCEIRSVFDGRHGGYVAAPAHPRDWDRGFVFDRCRFTCDKKVAPRSIYLARPWRDYGLSVFKDCTYDSHIHPDGFDKWNDTDRDRTCRFFETPCVPGRVPWINRS